MFLEKSDTDIEPCLCLHCLHCCHNKYRFSVLFVKFLSVLLIIFLFLSVGILPFKSLGLVRFFKYFFKEASSYSFVET